MGFVCVCFSVGVCVCFSDMSLKFITLLKCLTLCNLIVVAKRGPSCFCKTFCKT